VTEFRELWFSWLAWHKRCGLVWDCCWHTRQALLSHKGCVFLVPLVSYLTLTACTCVRVCSTFHKCLTLINTHTCKLRSFPTNAAGMLWFNGMHAYLSECCRDSGPATRAHHFPLLSCQNSPCQHLIVWLKLVCIIITKLI